MFGRIVKVVASILIAFAVMTVSTAGRGQQDLFPSHGDGVTIYILDNGFHTDLAVPADLVRARGGPLAQAVAHSDGQWLIYGWGDLGFYTANGFSVARAVDGLRALFWPGNASVIRVLSTDRRPDLAFAGTHPIMLSSAGAKALLSHIEQSMVVNDGVPERAEVQTQDAFYLSREHFSILRVCNNWTSDQLAAAGLRMTPMIDGVAPLLMLDLRLRDHVG